MTEPTSAATAPKCPEYVEIWADSFSQVIGQITGAPVPCRVLQESPTEVKPAVQDDLWVVVTSAGALRGEMSFHLSPASVLRLGQAFMSEPAAPDSPLTPDHRESVIELLRQVSGIVSTTARVRWGELQLRLEAVATPPSWPSAEIFLLEAGTETPPGTVLELGLSAALVAELRAVKTEETKAEVSEIATESSTLPTAHCQAAAGALDRLMDVQLSVSMRFGSRRLLLREVLELGPGAVVELDRRVQEPVDLLLDGRLVARGEVVVIDGNYGLRVSEVSAQALPPGRQDG